MAESSISGSKRSTNQVDAASEDSSDSSKKKCKRRWGAKSRWGDSDELEKESVLSGLPTVIPSGLTKEQEEQYLLQLQIEEITRRLQTGELGIPPIGERSPSPEPVYNHEGKRTNTREVRTRKKLESERHRLVQKMLTMNPQYRPPYDYRAPIIRFNERVYIPQDAHPEIGFIGMIIGPRGNSLRKIEKDTGTSVVIRGKGSVKEGRIGTKDGKPLPGADEPLHAYITSDVEENVKKGADRIRKIIDDAINVPDEHNEWMREQLRELAVINGTLRDSDTINRLRDLREAETIVTNKILCHMCGGAGHIARDCKQKRPGESLLELANQQQSAPPSQKAKLDEEYMSLMAELGQGAGPLTGMTMSQPRQPGTGTGGGAGLVGAQPQIHQHQSRMLALPPPSAGPPSLLSVATRPPFIPSSGGVGNMPPMSAGRGAVNGSSNSCPVAPNSGTNQPSMTDIAAGASLLIASVVQGLSQSSNNVPPPPPPPSSLWMNNSQSSRQSRPQYRAPPPWQQQQPQHGGANIQTGGPGFRTMPQPPPPLMAPRGRGGGFSGNRY